MMSISLNQQAKIVLATIVIVTGAGVASLWRRTDTPDNHEPTDNNVSQITTNQPNILTPPNFTPELAPVQEQIAQQYTPQVIKTSVVVHDSPQDESVSSSSAPTTVLKPELINQSKSSSAISEVNPFANVFANAFTEPVPVSNVSDETSEISDPVFELKPPDIQTDLPVEKPEETPPVEMTPPKDLLPAERPKESVLKPLPPVTDDVMVPLTRLENTVPTLDAMMPLVRFGTDQKMMIDNAAPMVPIRALPTEVK
jgi:hypothetical protein